MSDPTENAKHLMANPVFMEAFESAKKQAVDAALMCGPRDDDLRRRYLDAANVVDRVRTHIIAIASMGEEKVRPEDYYKDTAAERFKALFNL